MTGKLNVPDYICGNYRLIFNASGVVPFIIRSPRTLPWLLDFDAYSVVRPEILEFHNKCVLRSRFHRGLFIFSHYVAQKINVQAFDNLKNIKGCH